MSEGPFGTYGDQRIVDFGPPVQTHIMFPDKTVMFLSTEPRPNLFRRFFWWALLGVRFEKV